MKIHSVRKSTAVRHFGYDRATRELVVQFTSGNKFYTYPRVSKGIFTKMRKATSVGKFINEVIIPKYTEKNIKSSVILNQLDDGTFHGTTT